MSTSSRVGWRCRAVFIVTAFTLMTFALLLLLPTQAQAAEATPNTTTAVYELRYWLQDPVKDADGNYSEYSYIGSHMATGDVGDLPAVPAALPVDIVFPTVGGSPNDVANSYLFNAAKTVNTEVIDEKGTTAVNVYYDRKDITVYFNAFADYTANLIGYQITLPDGTTVSLPYNNIGYNSGTPADREPEGSGGGRDRSGYHFSAKIGEDLSPYWPSALSWQTSSEAPAIPVALDSGRLFWGSLTYYPDDTRAFRNFIPVDSDQRNLNTFASWSAYQGWDEVFISLGAIGASETFMTLSEDRYLQNLDGSYPDAPVTSQRYVISPLNASHATFFGAVSGFESPKAYYPEEIYQSTVGDLNALEPYIYPWYLVGASSHGQIAANATSEQISAWWPAIEYERSKYSIVFVTGNAPSNKQDGILYEQPLAEYDYRPEAPKGKEFIGWYSSPDFKESSKFDLTVETMPAKNMVLFAKWESAGGNLGALNVAPKSAGDDPSVLRVVRLFGEDRLGTSKQVALYGREAGNTDTLIVASSAEANFSDALTASGLSGQTGNAPIVLTVRDALSIEARETIVELAPSKVFIIGGSGAVSEGTEAAIRALVPDTTRLSGEDRQETAELIYAEYDASTWSSGAEVKTAILTRCDGFADALTISAYAAKSASPVFLTEFGNANLTLGTKAALAQGGFERLIVVGGTSAVSDNAITEALEAMDLGVDDLVRLGGANRYETATDIADWTTDAGGRVDSELLTYDKLAIARGDIHADALVGGALQGLSGSVVLLTAENNRAQAKSVITEQAATIGEIRLLGGPAAIELGTVKAYINAIPHTGINWIEPGTELDILTASLSRKG